ncbi:hypothetical protein HK104_002188 [Borealophlyctis nickersoniae]|nr:hypothetical protein HK104_002188 [Borealophlyctis nickersoniae]
MLATSVLVFTALTFVAILAERDAALAHVEQIVEKRTEELGAALKRVELERERAEAASKEKGTFMAFWAHEVLDIGRLESGAMPFNRKVVDLKKVLTTSIDAARELLQSYSISFTAKVEPDVPDIVETDPVRLQQVLSNLLANAFRLTSEGGRVALTVGVNRNGVGPNADSGKPSSKRRNTMTSVSIDLSEERIPTFLETKLPTVIEAQPDSRPASFRANFESEDSSQCVVLDISVEDTGIGVDPELVPLLFRPYAQTSINSIREYSGSGLGLAITGKIIHLMGGKVEVETELGVGSTFRVSVPLRIPVGNHSSDHIMLPSTSDHPAELDVGLLASFREIAENAKPLLGLSASSIRQNSESRVPARKISFTTGRSASSHSLAFLHINGMQQGAVSGEEQHADSNPRSHVTRTESIKSRLSVNQKQSLASHSRILVVDDSSINRSILLRMLGRLVPSDRFILDEAVNGQEAVDRVQRLRDEHCGQEYQIIFMDVVMPIMEGYDATRRIREMGCHAPIVIVTANRLVRQETDIAMGASGEGEAEQAGANEQIAKPFTKDMILSLLHRYRVL